MAARKTIEVRPLVEDINNAIRLRKNSDARSALCFVAEKVLMDTNNYRGFSYNGGYRPDDPDFDNWNRHYNLPVGEYF